MRVYSSPVLANVAVLKDVLETHGIGSEIRGEYRGSVGAGFIPAGESWPELWVLDESKVEEAEQVIQKALESSEGATAAWTCPKCHEEVEGQFDECWNCGKLRLQGWNT